MVNSERQKIVREIRRKYKGRKLVLAFYQEVARAFGGRCLSTVCQDSNDDLEFECKRNHVWKAVGASISQGNWCAKCQRLELAESRKWMIAICDEIAKEKGGQCITRVYVNSKTAMEWECKRQHRWWQKPKYIKKIWCMKCYLYEVKLKDKNGDGSL